ncbi:DUF3857 domain-containing transglutaminase family protein [Corallincola luteus]|nr:DUF3857 domain-containing protein [Corallincola luteus]
MYVKRIISALLVYSVLFGSVHAADAWKIAPEPSWITPITASLDRAPSTETIDYLLSDTQVNLTLSERNLYRHFTYRINDSLGVEENSDIEIVFNPDFEKVVFHHANILREGKVIERLNVQDIRLIDLEPEAASRIYSGHKQMTLWLKGVSQGDVIDYSYTLQGQNPVFDGHFNFFFDLGWAISVEHLSLRIVTDKGKPLAHKFINSDAELIETMHGEHRVYSVSMQHTQMVHQEGDNPSWEVVYPYLQVSDFSSWQEVGEWAVNLFDRADTSLSQDLIDYIADLKTLPKKQAIEKALSFSQEKVRYLGIEISENSHLPHSPSEVFANRYGDCKDKSLLLATMLNAIDVQAAPVLVSTESRHTIAQFLPAYNLFNHVITTFDFDGKRYWVDPTMSHQALTLEAISQAEFGMGLIAKKGSDQLTMMPASQAHQNLIRIRQQYKAADYASPVEWQISTTYSGREADYMRYRIASVGRQRLEKEYFNYYSQLFAGIDKIGSIEVQDDRHTNQLVVTENYLHPNFWTVDGSAARFSFYTDVIDSYIKLPTQVNRNQYLGLYGQVQVHQQLELVLPEHIDFSTTAERTVLENDFIRFETELSYEHRRLIYRSDYETKQRFVPPEQVSEHIALLRKARKFLEYGNSITHVTSEPSYGSMSKLVHYIQQQQRKTAL